MNTMTNKLLEVKLLVEPSIIEETLTRMGIPDNKNKILYQSCHLLKHFGTYYIGHFKQLFILGRGKDGFPGFGNVSLEDIERRNSIAFCLRFSSAIFMRLFLYFGFSATKVRIQFEIVKSETGIIFAILVFPMCWSR